ncbi:MAG TPA: hypothetical protein VHZ98_10340 [Galbitalea sp.]|nr:hypothetical protein [Galbitalea sp.]
MDQRVRTAGVCLERPLDQRSACWVDGDRVDKPSVEILSVIQVAEFGAPDGAAVFGLVAHLHLDVLSALTDLDFIHDVGNGFHGVGHVALTEFLFGRDQPYSLFKQRAFGDRGVGEVPEDTRAHVDDDVADLGVLVDVAQHLPEDRAFGNGLRRSARFYELFGDNGFQRPHPGERCFALGGDAVAVLVKVGGGVHLPFGGHAEIEHRLVGGDRVSSSSVAAGFPARGKVLKTSHRRESRSLLDCRIGHFFAVLRFGLPFRAGAFGPDPRKAS